VALITAWTRGFGGASKQDTERWLAAAKDEGYGGPPPAGMSSPAFGAALARATLIFDDVGRPAAAARRAVELAGDQPAEYAWAGSALGQALYLSGQAAKARPPLEDLVSQVPASVQPYAVVTALAVLSLLAADQDDPAAAPLARQGELGEPRSSWSGRCCCSRSTAWACTAPTGCWCSRRCGTVGATCQALGRWSTRPASWSTRRPILACSPRC